MKKTKFRIVLLFFLIISCSPLNTRHKEHQKEDSFMIKSMATIDNANYKYIDFPIGYDLPHIRDIDFSDIKEDSITIKGELYKSTNKKGFITNILLGEDENNSSGRIKYTILNDVQNGQEIKFTISSNKANRIIIQSTMSDSSYIYQIQ